MIQNPTKHTLNRAKNHVSRMKETLQNDEDFSSCLSDFAQAARSITFHMQKQYAGKEGFGDKNGGAWNGWYGFKEAEMRKIPSLRFLIKARNYCEKEGPLPLGATRELGLNSNADIVDKSKPDALACEIKESLPALEPPKPKTINRWFWDVSSYLDKGDKSHVPDFEKADVIKTCEDILDYLDKLVNECEEKFSQL